jgi:hypothetical protein
VLLLVPKDPRRHRPESFDLRRPQLITASYKKIIAIQKRQAQPYQKCAGEELVEAMSVLAHHVAWNTGRVATSFVLRPSEVKDKACLRWLTRRDVIEKYRATMMASSVPMNSNIIVLEFPPPPL